MSDSSCLLDKIILLFYRNILDSTVQGIARFGTLVIAAALLYTTRSTVVAAYADLLAARDTAGLEQAAKLQPGNAQYWERLSLPLAIPSPKYIAAIENAASAAPHNSRLWMKLGDAAAAGGDFRKAERAYLEVARLNRGYDSHWLLANLYFRQGDAPNFWIQMRQALAFDTRDLGPAFELCWTMTPKADDLLNSLPKNPKILARYLQFLVSTNRLPEAADAAQVLIAIRGTGEQEPTLIAYTDRLLTDNRNQEAAKIWTAIHPGASPDINLLFNAQMLDPFTGRGFDWRLDAPGNIGHIQIPALSQVEFQFDGNQPEKCDLVSQPLALPPGSAARLTFEYRTLDITTGHSGLRWRVLDPDSGEIQVSEEMASPTWKSSVMLFRLPPKSRGQRLVLSYERLRGTTRISGSLAVRTLVLKRVGS